MGFEEYETLKREFTSANFKRELRKKKGIRCLYCRAEGVEYHHIIPLSQGGDNRLVNIVPLCRLCHMKAHDRKPIEGKVYESKGRGRIKLTKEQERTMQAYFNGEIGAFSAMEAMDIKRSTFYRIRQEYMDSHGIKKFRTKAGCKYNGYGTHKHT